MCESVRVSTECESIDRESKSKVVGVSSSKASAESDSTRPDRMSQALRHVSYGPQQVTFR